jgi:hypothetical protein
MCLFFLAKPHFFFVLWLFWLEWRQDVEKSSQFFLISSLVLLEWGRFQIEKTHFLRVLWPGRARDAPNGLVEALGKQEETHFELEMTPFQLE